MNEKPSQTRLIGLIAVLVSITLILFVLFALFRTRENALRLLESLGAFAFFSWPWTGLILGSLATFRRGRARILAGAITGLLLQSAVAAVWFIWGIGLIRG